MNYADSASLDSIFVQCWIDLAQGAGRSSHAYHTPALANRGATGPEIRTVVLREVNAGARRLVCYTDRRSPKVQQLQQDAVVAWLFYDPATQTQLRIRGTACVHHQDELARSRWEGTDPVHRQQYRTPYAPGIVLPSPGTGELTGPGFEHFTVIGTEVTVLDWLYLQPEGNLRARFRWRDGHWRSSWLAP